MLSQGKRTPRRVYDTRGEAGQTNHILLYTGSLLSLERLLVGWAHMFPEMMNYRCLTTRK